jgi:hypothetical protein
MLRYLINDPRSKLHKEVCIYSTNNEYKCNHWWRWLVICDDSTYIDLHNVLDYIASISEIREHIFLANNSVGTPNSYRLHTMIFGPSLLERLSRLEEFAMEKKVTIDEAPCREYDSNDAILLKCLSSFLNIKPRIVEGFLLDCELDYYKSKEYEKNKIVSIKNLSEEEFYMVDGIIKSSTIEYNTPLGEDKFEDITLDNVLFSVLTTSMYHR